MPTRRKSNKNKVKSRRRKSPKQKSKSRRRKTSPRRKSSNFIQLPNYPIGSLQSQTAYDLIKRSRNLHSDRRSLESNCLQYSAGRGPQWCRYLPPPPHFSGVTETAYRYGTPTLLDRLPKDIQQKIYNIPQCYDIADQLFPGYYSLYPKTLLATAREQLRIATGNRNWLKSDVKDTEDVVEELIIRYILAHDIKTGDILFIGARGQNPELWDTRPSGDLIGDVSFIFVDTDRLWDLGGSYLYQVDPQWLKNKQNITIAIEQVLASIQSHNKPLYGEVYDKDYSVVIEEINKFSKKDRPLPLQVYTFPPEDIERLVTELTRAYKDEAGFTSTFIELLRKSLHNYSTTDRVLEGRWSTYYADGADYDGLYGYLIDEVQSYFNDGGRGEQFYPDFMRNIN